MQINIISAQRTIIIKKTHIFMVNLHFPPHIDLVQCDSLNSTTAVSESYHRENQKLWTSEKTGKGSKIYLTTCTEEPPLLVEDFKYGTLKVCMREETRHFSRFKVYIMGPIKNQSRLHIAILFYRLKLQQSTVTSTCS